MNFTDHIWSTQCRSVVVVVSGTAGGGGLVSPAAAMDNDDSYGLGYYCNTYLLATYDRPQLLLGSSSSP